jgi:hypothetical protein
MDEEIEGIDRGKARYEARDGESQRTQLEGFWQHLEGNGPEQYAARKAEGARHE